MKRLNKSLNFVNKKVIQFCEKLFNQNHIQVLFKFATDSSESLVQNISANELTNRIKHA